jgi:hypothetical protein
MACLAARQREGSRYRPAHPPLPEGSSVSVVSDAMLGTVLGRGPVTSFQQSFLVSDQGTATIWGNDAGTRAAQITSEVAHPSA